MKSFLQGKKSLSIPALRLPPGLESASAPSRDSVRTSGAKAASSPQSPAHAHAPSAAGAHVEVVKEGDKVVRLIVTCTCGERVEVECIYPAGS